MTVSSAITLYADHNGNGVTTAFPFTFPSTEDSQIQVWHYDADGVATQWTAGVQYTLARTNSGGTVTASVALPSGESIRVVPVYPLEQTADFTAQARFSPEIHEAAIDYLALLVAQAAHGLSRFAEPPTDPRGRYRLHDVNIDLFEGDSLSYENEDVLPLLSTVLAGDFATQAGMEAAVAAAVSAEFVAELPGAVSTALSGALKSSAYGTETDKAPSVAATDEALGDLATLIQGVSDGLSGDISLLGGQIPSVATDPNALPTGSVVGITNVTEVGGASAMVTQVEDMVFFSMRVTITPTAAGLVIFEVDPPVTLYSDFVDSSHCMGVSGTQLGDAGVLSANTTSQRIVVSYAASGGGVQTVLATGHYYLGTP